ncbi:MAG TPA: SDR family oxidoreductase [Acidobacteriaceae bacterium]|nr:SDR family oxidoreductase [Acidobacteriaceae bacterium]
MQDRDAHKVVVITGATGGIGAEVARALSTAGYRLVINARSAEKLSALAAQLKTPVVCIPGDLRDSALPASLLSSAMDRFGRCDVCFNNGGVLEVGPIKTINIDQVCDMVRINVEAAFRIAYVFARHFVLQGSGHLIHTSSVLGKKVRPTAGAYAGTKFAMEALAEAMRMELSKTDVQVSCIQPGLVRTGLHDRWETHPTELMGIPEPLTPADIARMVVFILSQPPHVRIPQMMMLPKGHEI